MGISKPSQGWAEHQKDMAVLYFVLFFVMLEHIISASSRPGDVVLDCFMGSGSTGKACAKHQKDLAVLYFMTSVTAKKVALFAATMPSSLWR